MILFCNLNFQCKYFCGLLPFYKSELSNIHLFYTFQGGLKAVVWTDVIQTIVMVGAMILVIIKGTVNVGGFQTVLERNWNTDRLEFPS